MSVAQLSRIFLFYHFWSKEEVVIYFIYRKGDKETDKYPWSLSGISENYSDKS